VDGRGSSGHRLRRLYALVVAIVGCAAPPPSTKALPVGTSALARTDSPAALAAPRVLSGQVRLAGGMPAAGALVVLVPHFELDYPGASPRVAMTTANAAGQYAFASTEEGHYAVTATLGSAAPGAYGGVHDLAAGKPLTVNLELGQGGAVLSGNVENAHGGRTAAARIEAVRISDNEAEVYMTTTDAAGRYELRVPGDTAYFLVADASPLPRSWRRIEPVSQAVDFKLDRAPAPRPTDAELRAFLAESVIPLATIQPGQGSTDLAPLKKLIGDAHVVAIGEPVHGSGEFWTLRHRLIEYLATELGFTTVAIEATWSDALALDEYVTTGRGDPMKGLADLYYWQPNCEETLSLVRWMRRYNQNPSHAKKLHFLGFDVEFTSHAVPAVIAYLDKVDTLLAAHARDFLAPLRETSAEGTYGGLSAAVQTKTRDELAHILARFDTEHTRWAAKLGEAAWKTAREHAHMIRRTERVYRDFTLRDMAMAETVESILSREPQGAKIVLLGHNSHLSAKRVELSEMGALLRERHGSDYFVLGTTFGSGSLLAIPMKNAGAAPGKRPIEAFTLGAPPANGLESALALAQKDLFLVDLRISSGKVGDWLSSKMPTRWVGGIFRGEENSNIPLSPKRSYDALISIDKITPSHLNPGAH